MIVFAKYLSTIFKFKVIKNFHALISDYDIISDI